MEVTMREMVDAIKKRLRDSGNIPRYYERQTGKSTALLEIAYEDYRGDVFIFCLNDAMAKIMRNRYREMYPESNEARCVTRIEQVVGYNWPILVDEWFLYSDEMQKKLFYTGRLTAAVGSLPVM